MTDSYPYAVPRDAATRAEDGFLASLAWFNEPGVPCLRLTWNWSKLDQLSTAGMAALRRDVSKHVRDGCVFCLASSMVLGWAGHSASERAGVELQLGRILENLRSRVLVKSVLQGGEQPTAERARPRTVLPPRPSQPIEETMRIACSLTARRWSTRERPSPELDTGSVSASPYCRLPTALVFHAVDEALSELDARFQDRTDVPSGAIERLDQAGLGSGAGILVETGQLWTLHVETATEDGLEELVERLVRTFDFLVRGDLGAARGEAGGWFQLLEL